MAVTKSGQNNLTSPDGNGLALFVDINDGGLKMKDINGNIENVSSYVYSRPLDAGVLMMDNGFALSSTIALIQDQNNNNSRLYLATNQITAGVDFRDSITNTGFGVDALLNITTGGYNTAFGYNALKNNTTSDGNTAIGYSAMGDCLLNNGSSAGNIAIGYNALNSETGVYQNVIAIGTDAFTDITGNSSFTDTVAIGLNVLRANNLTQSSIAIGTNAMRNGSMITSVAIGKDVGYTEFGSYAGNSLLIGNSIGAGGGFTFGSTVAIGNEIGYLSQSMGGSVAIGYQAMYQNTVSSTDIAIGYQAMFSTGYAVPEYGAQTENNIAIGYRALYNICSEDLVGNSTFNIGIGYEALYGTDGILMESLIGIGYQAAKTPLPFDAGVTNGVPAIAIGANAGTNAPTSTIFIGSEAGYAATGTQNIGIGYRALNVATGIQNTAFGSNALLSSTTANNNTAIGTDSLKLLTTSIDNTAVGYSALSGVTTGAGLNVGIGSSVATALTTGTRNVYVGASATASSTSDSNVVIGQGAVGTGSNNTLVGQGASTGGFSGSVILGKGATATANNQFVLGSTGTPVGTLATETVVSDRSWSVIINGTTYKVLLKA